MDAELTLKIGRIALDVDADERAGPQASAQLRAAFEILAKRLSASPFGKSLVMQRVVIERLELGTVQVDELLSARGAERIADDLYRHITGGP